MPSARCIGKHCMDEIITSIAFLHSACSCYRCHLFISRSLARFRNLLERPKTLTGHNEEHAKLAHLIPCRLAKGLLGSYMCGCPSHSRISDPYTGVPPVGLELFRRGRRWRHTLPFL
jgi:hypothetical protein